MWYENFYPQFYFVTASGIAGAIVLHRLSAIGKLVWIIVVLNIITEIYTTYLAEHGRHTAWCYNILNPIEQFITIYIYSKIYIKNNKDKLLALGILLLIASVVNIVFVQGMDSLDTYTLIPGGIFMAVISYITIRGFIINENNILNNLIFWFSTANVVYYSIMIPIIAIIPLAIEVSIKLAYNFKIVNDAGYCFWSLLILIGFLWGKKRII